MLYQLRQTPFIRTIHPGFHKAPAFFAFVFILLAINTAATVSNAFETDKLKIKTGKGDHEFIVEIADEPAEQARGLMFRRELADDKGMLFIYPDDKERSMWMKNTYISLDMLFIDRTGKIYNIVRETEPFSEQSILSGGPGRAVLELSAGTVDRLDIRVGDRVEYRTFLK